MARTRAHPPRRLAMSRASRGSSKLIVRPAPPLPPEEALSWGMPPAVRIVGPEDPRPQSPSRGGANVGSRALLSASLVCRALYPSHPPLPSWGGFRGLWAARLSGEARRQPPAIIRSGSPGHWPATGSRTLPGPWEVPDEGQLLHHLRPSPPAPGPQAHRKRGPSTRNNQNTSI